MQAQASLIDLINAQLASDQQRLPVYSPVAAHLQRHMQKDNRTVQQLARILSHDAALAGQVLRVANSSFYAGLTKVASIEAAIQRLGEEQIAQLAVACAQRDQFRSKDPLIERHAAQLWRHSLAAALGARWLAIRCGFEQMAAEAFLAGLFHDIGELLLLKVLEEIRCDQPSQPMPDALVLEVLDALHPEQGARLIQAWNLPEKFAQVALTHHTADSDAVGTLCLLVRLANHACLKLGIDLRPAAPIVLSACSESAALGVSDIVLAELEIVIEDGIAKLGAL